MNVELRRRPGRIIVMIDGQPYLGTEAAAKLGMKPKTLAKRIERGTRLTKPLQRNGSWHGL